MGKYYKDIDQFHEIIGGFLNRLLQDPLVGPKLAKAGLIVKFIYTDPDTEVTIDLKNKPDKPGFHGTYYIGPCDVKEDVWSKQSADFSHTFWHGYENAVMAVALGKVKQGGNVVKMMKLLPAMKPAFKLFPVVLEELGFKDLVVKKKWF